MSILLHVISLGAGVQSTTMALKAAHGEIEPMPDAAIFSDTEGEPAAVYRHLDWLMSGVLPYPVYKVSRGSLWKSATTVRTRRDGKASYIKTAIPVFMVDGQKRGMGKRTCTRDYKIEPVIKKMRQLLGRRSIRKTEGVLVETWMGISTDEAIRMKPSRESWIRNRWPLIEQRMSRQDCLNWCSRNGYPIPPKSSCTYCPYHSDEAWLKLTADEFADAVVKERELQAAYAQASRMRGTPYLHSSCVPLSEVVFDKDRPSKAQLDLFLNECEGMCGV